MNIVPMIHKENEKNIKKTIKIIFTFCAKNSRIRLSG